MAELDLEQNASLPMEHTNDGSGTFTSVAELAALTALCISVHNTAINLPLPMKVLPRFLLDSAQGTSGLAVVSSIAAVAIHRGAVVKISIAQKGLSLRAVAICIAVISAVVAVILMTAARITDELALNSTPT